MAQLIRSKRRSRPEDARAAGRSPKPVSHIFLHRLSALVIMGVILLTGLPARAHDFNLETGSGWIKGYAKQAPLGAILSQLAQRNGCKVYIDEKLAAVPVTFDIPAAFDAERAIRRIVHPFSYALVFSRLPQTGDLRIDQVKVFSEGSGSNKYMQLTGDGGAPVVSSSYTRGYDRTSAMSSKVLAGKAAVDRHVKPMVKITKSSMGFTGYSFGDHRRGPNYNPDISMMAKSYADHRKDRESLENRSSSALLLDGHRKAELEKMKVRSQRTASIQKTLEASQMQVKEVK